MNEKKYTYTLQAKYAGSSEIKKLNSDLKELKSIEALQGMYDSFNQTNKVLIDAKARLRDLRQDLKKPGGSAFTESYKKAKNEVNALVTSLEKQKSKINTAREDLRRAGVNVTDLAGRYNELKTATEKQARVMAAQAKLGVKPFGQVKREIEGLKRAYRDLESSGTASIQELAVAKTRLRGKIRDLQKDTNGWNRNISLIQQSWAGVLGTVGAVMAAQRGIRFFAGFDDSMRSVKAVLGGTEEQFRQLTDFAKKLGKTTAFSATEAAQGMEELAQSGMKANEIITTLPHALNMASVSGRTMKESADLITDTLKQFGLQVRDSGAVSDILVKGYTGASTSLQQLGEALSYAGPVANAFGMSLQDTVAVLQTYSEAGFKGSRAGTAMVGGLTRLVKPVGAAKDVLEKYSIQVFDSSGAVRNFADILEDLEKASLSPTEMMQLFGQEAGPGMAGLLAQGADAIRDFRKELDGVNGIGAKIAGEKEGGIGGALRSLSSSLQAVVLAFAESLAPAIQLAADMLAALARLAASLPNSLKIAISTMAAATTVTFAWHLGLKHIVEVLRVAVSSVLSFGSKVDSIAPKVNLMSTALKSVGRVFALWAAWDIGYTIGTWLNQFDIVKKAGIALSAGLTKSFLKIKQAWAWVTGGDTDAIQREIDEAERIYSEMFANVGKEAKEAGAKWKEVHRDTAKAAGESAQKQSQVTGEALDEMKRQYQEYADEIKRLQNEIADRERSVAEQLRAMNRVGMSAPAAWRDMKREAEEYERAARKAAKEGDLSGAVEWADKARGKYAALNTEVKDGNKVIISQEAAKKTAMDGVARAAELAADALKKQEATNKKAADELNEASGWQLAEKTIKSVSEATDKYATIAVPRMGKAWTLVWDNAEKEGKAMIKEIDIAMTNMMNKPRNMNVNVTTTQGRAHGGLITQFPAFAQGGIAGLSHSFAQSFSGFKAMSTGQHLSGYGGGDRIRALLEAGEFVIRKEAVKKYGVDLFSALNAMRIDSLNTIKARIGGLVRPLQMEPIKMQSGGQVPAPRPQQTNTYHVSISFNEPMGTNSFQLKNQANEMLRQFQLALEGSS